MLLSLSLDGTADYPQGAPGHFGARAGLHRYLKSASDKHLKTRLVLFLPQY
jgi:hypothetical protein